MIFVWISITDIRLSGIKAILNTIMANGIIMGLEYFSPAALEKVYTAKKKTVARYNSADITHMKTNSDSILWKNLPILISVAMLKTGRNSSRLAG